MDECEVGRACSTCEVGEKWIGVFFGWGKPEGKNRTEQNRTEQNRTEQNRTEQNRTEQNRTEQNRTEQNRPEHGCPADKSSIF